MRPQSCLKGALIVWALTATALPARADDAAEQGVELMARLGCLSCHSLDGTARVGPPLAGRFGSYVRVRVDGVVLTGPFDADYIARSLRDPQAEVAAGYAPVMPAYALDDTQVAAIAAALEALPLPEPSEPHGFAMLVIGLLLFTFGHLVLSSGPIRGALVARITAGGFMSLYSLVVGAGLGLLIWGWSRAPFVGLWDPLPWTRWVPLLVMPLAMIFFVFGLTTPSPTQAMQEKTLGAANPAPGILAITRHPQLWAYALWAASHLPPNGDVATVLFIGAFFVLAVGGMLHIDRRRARTEGEAWRRFADRTSLVPFAALLSGRAKLAFGWGDLLRLVGAVALYFGFIAVHARLIGAWPLPWGGS
ncbi:MAG: hypothetical protein KC620_01505 [Myxococcales bacterium]|nr:hypothetical protein [Myxococcales bacterium]